MYFLNVLHILKSYPFQFRKQENWELSLVKMEVAKFALSWVSPKAAVQKVSRLTSSFLFLQSINFILLYKFLNYPHVFINFFKI